MAVRREAVRLEVEDSFTNEILKAAAAVKVLDASLDGLGSRTTTSSRSTNVFRRDVDNLGTSSNRTAKAIDSMSGRIGILVRTTAILGPALAPIGSVGIVAVSGLANQLGFAAVAAGTAVLAFQGVGTALEAVNKAALDPTVENLQAARDAMRELSPAARDLVRQLQSMRPLMDQFQGTAAQGMFPGLVSGLQDIERIAPQLNSVIDAVSSSLGDLFAAAGDDLAGGRWDDFFNLLATEAKPTLSALGSAVGDVVHGMTELWEAFAPLNRDFSSWMADAANGFSDWAAGLDETEGFQEFVAYLRQNGPKVADAAQAIGSALVEIVEAAAPLGGPTLDVITAIAKAIGAIADSPLGTPLLGFASAMSAVSLAMRPLNSGLGMLEGRFGRVGTAATTARAGLSGWGPKAAGIMAVGYAIGSLGDAIANATGAKMDLSDLDRDLQAIANNGSTERLALIIADLEKASASWAESGEWFREPMSHLLPGVGDSPTDTAIKNLDDIDAALAQLVESGNGEQARRILENIAAAQNGLAPGSSMAPSVLDELAESFPSYATAAENAAAATNDVAGASDKAGRAQERLALKSQMAAARMSEQRAAFREAASAFVDFGNSLKPSEFTLDDWLSDIERGITAMRNLRLNAEKAGENGIRKGLIDHLRKLGPEGATQLARLADANEGMVNRANADWRRYQAELRRNGLMLDELGNIVARPQVKLESNVQAAVAETIRFLNGIPDETVWINVRRTGTENGTGGFGPQNPNGADGMTVPGKRAPYGDKVYAYLAPGEEVISNRYGQADRHRSLLKRINANAMADGGTAGGDRLPTLRDLRGATDLEIRRALREWTRAIDDSREALSKEREERDAVVSRMRDVSNSIQDGIRADLFSGEVNPWSSDFAAGSIGGVKRDLREDIAEASAMSKAIKTLRNKGLTGPALAELLAQGLDSAVAFSKLPASELKQFAKLYGQRNRALRQVGQLGGNAAFGDALAQQNAELRAARENTKRLESRLKDIERAIERADHRNDDNHRKDRDNNRRGAGNGNRNRRRDR